MNKLTKYLTTKKRWESLTLEEKEERAWKVEWEALNRKLMKETPQLDKKCSECRKKF